MRLTQVLPAAALTALLLSGCGAETNTDAVQPDVPDASSEAA